MSDFKNVKAGERVPFKSYAVADKNAKFKLWQGSRHGRTRYNNRNQILRYLPQRHPQRKKRVARGHLSYGART